MPLSNFIKKTKFFRVLYVEDDIKLQEETAILLKKFFKNVFIASNGKDSLTLYQKESPDIIITDIQMPFMDGLEFSKKIKEINPKAEIIITSAFDEKKFLFDAINIGISKYMIKPIKISQLIEVIEKSIDKLIVEKKVEGMQKLENIFAHEKNILILVENDNIKLCNKSFLNFFGVKNLKEFKERHNFFKEIKFKNINEEFNSTNVFEYIKKDINKIFKVEIKNYEDKKENFLLIFNKLPNTNEYTMLFIDVTNIIFDFDRVKQDFEIEYKLKEEEIQTVFNKIKNYDENVKFYNTYKGLTIFHDGKIAKVINSKIEVEIDKFQLLAFEHEKSTFLHSKFLKKDIVAKVEEVNVEAKSAILSEFKYLNTSPRNREATRVYVQEELAASIEGEEFFIGGKIVDISTKSLGIKIKEIPPKLKLESKVKLYFSLPIDQKEEIDIEIDGKVVKIIKNTNWYIIAILITPNTKAEKEIVDYIAKRQIDIIKEFRKNIF